MKKTGFILCVVFAIGLFFIIKMYEGEITTKERATLSPDEINSEVYPWSKYIGTIKTVSNYKEVYDFDSNDWAARFSLRTDELRNLVIRLPPLPEKILNSYRCVGIHKQKWMPEYICDISKMTSAGFKSYYYLAALCSAGCKQDIVLWINEKNGTSYIVGSPHYD